MTTDTTYDLAVIGGGPGGYVAAIRAAQLGLTVVCIEKRATLGGTCLNVGCIPSKAMLQSSHHFEAAAHDFANHGIKVTPRLDLTTMLARKDKVVLDLTKGIAFLFKKNGITSIQGTATITAPGQISIDGKDSQTLSARNILIATGSDTAPLPGAQIDEDRVVSSTGALALPKVPKSLVVVGGGVIGLELGSVWRRLGSEITVIEYLDTILPGMDAEICETMTRLLKKQGMAFKLGHRVSEVKTGKTGVSVSVEPRDGGKSERIKADTVLVSIGRRPFTAGLGLEGLGVSMDEHGFIQVDHDFQTNLPGIYAIGDVIGGAMLAHKAEEEGVAVAEILAGQSGHVNYDAIPSVVYTFPEVASVGKTERQLTEEGIAYRVGKFPLTANSRARCNAETDGFVKILSEAASDQVLGAHVIAPSAGDLISEIVLCMEFGGSAEDIARSCHAHPSLSEAIKEAALAVDDRAIHA